MEKLYVLGGRQRPDAKKRKEWQAYAAAVAIELDLDSGAIAERIHYVSPPVRCPSDHPSFVFKAGTLCGNQLLACTQTEIIEFVLPSFEIARSLSHPWFNDVHHVHPGTNGTLLVANTGLDMVVELSPEGHVKGEWTTTEVDTWTRFSRGVDYRRVATTKPHLAHPNHIFILDGDVWVTRCDRADAICLTRRELLPIDLNVTRPVHDGRVCDGRIYFTSVDGRLIVVDAETREVESELRIAELTGDRTPLGWCRGLEFLDDDLVVLGFSRLRPTRWEQNVRWVKRALGGRGWGLLPTRLMCVDLQRREICWERNLEPHINAVFSLHRGGTLGRAESPRS